MHAIPPRFDWRRHLAGPLALLGLGAAFGASAQTADALAVTDRMIIKYRDGSVAAKTPDFNTMSAAHVAVNRAGAQMRRLRGTAFGGHVMKMDRVMGVQAARELARQIMAGDANVEYAEPDLVLRKQLVPNDASYLSQWHYYEATGGLNLPAAWDVSTGTGIVVAVVDTGYRPHVDLAANIVGGYDFIGDAAVGNDGGGRDADASDPGDATIANECGAGEPADSSSWHGTHVAGTIAAVTGNGTGVAGVAFGAKVLPVRVLGKCGGYTSDIADGVVWASGGTVSGVPANAFPARVINLSLGGGGTCGTTMQNAINSARSRGAVIVVAAGNSNVNASNATPANCAGVVTVASTNRSGGKSYFSNFGTVVDVAAPGGDMRSGAANGILSTLNSGATGPGADTYAYYQGTSMATPHVAGVAALMLSANPALTPDQVESLLRSTARAFPVACSGCGTGIVDAAAAVNAAKGFVPTVTTVAETTANNNTLNRAQVLGTLPLRVNGSISSTSDTDYYLLSVPGGASVTATLTSASAQGNVNLAVYNSAGSLVASTSTGLGVADVLTVRNTGTAAATMYVRVLRGTGTTAASFNYQLNLTSP